MLIFEGQIPGPDKRKSIRTLTDQVDFGSLYAWMHAYIAQLRGYNS